MSVNVLKHEDVLDLLPDRKIYSNKGDYGKVLLLCGSVGYTGAVALAANGAIRVGAGLVYVGVPESIYTIAAIKLTEQIVFPLPADGAGYSECSFAALEHHITNKNAILVGPGIGRSKGAQALTRSILENYCGPVVLDADGINNMVSHKDVLRGRRSQTVITPHEGEFARLTGKKIENREAEAKAVANDLGVIVVLKGHRTIITDGSVVYENPTGNPGLAVGGSGDVLSGMITGLIGQGIPLLEATAAAVWLHGAAADLCAKHMGQYAMFPSDLFDFLPRLMK